MMYVVCLVVAICLFLQDVSAFHPTALLLQHRTTRLHMGFGDMLKKAFANDPNLPPATNPGLSRAAESVEVEFLPMKKTVKAYRGQKLSTIAQTAGVEIKYKCNKGDCGTCTVKFDGLLTKTCQTALPTTGNVKKHTITVATFK